MEGCENPAKLFRALGDPKRIQILSRLKDGEKCACVLLEDLSLSQSGLSYHMRILCESHLVKGREEGKWVHYRLNAKGFERATAVLGELCPSDVPAEDSPLLI